MPLRIGADYWRKRALEADAEGLRMPNPDARALMHQVAESYRRLAEMAERKESDRDLRIRAANPSSVGWS